MKRKWLVLALVVLCLAAGCGNQAGTTNQAADTGATTEADQTETVWQSTDADLSSEQDVTSETETVSDATEKVPATEVAEVPQAPYQVTMVNYKKSDLLDINYPQISGWENTEKQQEWNDIFLQQAEDAANELGENDSVTLIFTVEQQDADLLSLTCTSYYDYEGAAHPSAGMSSYNINMQTGEKVTFAELADSAQTAKNLFAGTNCTVIGNDDVTMQDILEYNFIWMQPTEEALAASLSHFDGEYENYGENETMGESFVRDGKVCLILYVNHAMGDYVVVELN